VSLRLPPEEYDRLCQEVLRRDGYMCRNCGFRSVLHVHHVWFRSQGGPDLAWNLLTLCSACHSGVHTAIRNGEHGLTIEVNAVTGEVTIRRASWWKPQ
jgi:5-methylcytosine-specific restriction endonuclease McrA